MIITTHTELVHKCWLISSLLSALCCTRYKFCGCNIAGPWYWILKHEWWQTFFKKINRKNNGLKNHQLAPIPSLHYSVTWLHNYSCMISNTDLHNENPNNYLYVQYFAKVLSHPWPLISLYFGWKIRQELQWCAQPWNLVYDIRAGITLI